MLMKYLKIREEKGLAYSVRGSVSREKDYAYYSIYAGTKKESLKEVKKIILEEFEKQNVNFALEVHPTEIAFDIATAQRALEAVKKHKRFGFNYDPSHLGYQGVDYVKFIRTFSDRIYHAHMKDAWWGHGDGTVGVFGGHTTFCDPRRQWDFRSVGRGDVNFEEIIVALNDIQYSGPLSIEWEDGRMDRFHGATESCEFVKNLDFKSNEMAFDSAFDKKNQ